MSEYINYKEKSDEELREIIDTQFVDIDYKFNALYELFNRMNDDIHRLKMKNMRFG